MTKDEMIQRAYLVFSTFKRPEYFVDTTDSPECYEHNETLKRVSLKEIGPEQVGHPGWSPLPYLLPEALGYLMPRFIEIALNNMPNSDGEPFVIDFVRLLVLASPEKFNSFSIEQNTIMLKVFTEIRTRMYDILKLKGYLEELEQSIQLFSKQA